LESFAVYGSVARGAASNHSDINILLVSDSFEGSLTSRLNKLYQVEGQLEGELRLLRGHGAYTPLSLYPSEKGGGHEDAAALLDLTRRPQYSMTGMIFSNSYYSSLRRSYG
jgi:hypothetical protein